MRYGVEHEIQDKSWLLWLTKRGRNILATNTGWNLTMVVKVFFGHKIVCEGLQSVAHETPEPTGFSR